MTLNPTKSGDSHNWNYSKAEKDGYSTSITGTVAAIQETQAMNFGSDGMPSTPKFWDNSGQPVMNIRLVLVGPSGGFRTWTITPAGKAAKEGKKKSVHLDLFALAGGVNMLDLVGKTITVSTEAPPSGFSYGVGNPRPWAVALAPEGTGPFELAEPLDPIFRLPVVLADTAVSGGMMQPQAPQAPQAQQPVVNPGTPEQDAVAGITDNSQSETPPQPAPPSEVPF